MYECFSQLIILDRFCLPHCKVLRFLPLLTVKSNYYIYIFKLLYSCCQYFKDLNSPEVFPVFSIAWISSETVKINFLKLLIRQRYQLKPMSMAKDVASFFAGEESINNHKLIYPAATRNQEPILQVLKRFIISDVDSIEDEESPLFLEIASGSGQHLAHFAPNFPGVKFQPTEVDDSLLASIKYYADHCPTKNILQPILIDVCNKFSFYGFKENSVDYMYNANMIHISPFDCTIGLFENAGNYLKPDALMITYGPYSKDGVITPESNVQFDASLRARNAAWGIRDITDLIKLAEDNNLTLMDTIEMPANNKTLIWKKN